MTNNSLKSNILVTDPISKLDWKCCIEGKFELDEAVQKFGEPDQDGWRLPTIEELKTLINNKLTISELPTVWISMTLLPFGHPQDMRFPLRALGQSVFTSSI